MTPYTGQLEKVSCGEVTLVTRDGQRIRDIDLSAKPDVPMNTGLDVVLDGKLLYSWRLSPLCPMGETPRNRKMLLFLARPEGHEFTEQEIADHEERARWVQDEWNYALQNRGSMEIDVLYVNVPEDQLGFYDFPVEPFRREHPGYTHYHGVGGFHSQYAGLAHIGGYWAWTYGNGTNPTTAHEHGHSEGLSHDGMGNRPYAGLHIMGNRGDRRDFAGPQRGHIGLTSEEHVVELEVGQSRQVHLVDPDTLDIAVPMGANKLVICRRAQPPYRVAVAIEGDDVLVYEPWNINSRQWGQTRSLKILRHGMFERYGIKVQRMGAQGSIVTVNVQNQSSTTPEQIRRPAFAYPESAEPFADKSGLWINPDWKLQGIQVRYLEDRHAVYVTWLTWDLNYNTRRFQGQLDIGADGIARGSIRSGREDEIVGEASLFFTSPGAGMFRAQTPETGLCAIPLSRLSVADPFGYSGRFGIGNREGLVLEQTSDGRIVGFLLDYENEGTVHAPRYGSTWKALQEVDGVLNVYRAEYGRRHIAGKDARIVKIGEAQITRRDGQRDTITLPSRTGAVEMGQLA